MKSKNRAVLSKFVNKVFETPSHDYSEWFGYYNYDTLNYDQTKMLCNRSDTEGKSPKKDQVIELGYYDLPTGEWHNIGFSDSWNWQQGAMLQWLPGKGNENKVIFNTSSNNRIVSIIHDIATGEDIKIDWGIYGITPDGLKSISLDFERSYWCRAYHYQSVANNEKEGRIFEDDGIFEIDLTNNTRKRIISIRDIVEIMPDDDFNKKKHWIEHIMISPEGNKIAFLHRYSSIENVYDYGTRVCVADIDGSNIQIIPGWDKYDWSHFGWEGEKAFSIYTYKKGRFHDIRSFRQIISRNFNFREFFQRSFLTIIVRMPRYVRKNVLGKDSYYQFYKSDLSGIYKLNDIFSSQLFEIDGHPSFSRNSIYMITDTYPDKSSYNNLIIYNMISRKGLIVAKFLEPLRGTSAACDLHPKLSNNNRYVVVDSTYSGKHQMVILEINWDKIKQEIG